MSSADYQNRNYGLDLYRIIAMTMITCLHLNNQHFGLLDPNQPRVLFTAGLFIEYFCFSGVNCFAIISGYFLGGRAADYDRKWFVHYAGFYCKIVLWYLLLSLVCKFILHIGYGFFQKSGWTEILFSPFNGWWYISAYMGALALLPLLNRALKGLTGWELGKISLLLVVVFSLVPLHILNTDSMAVRKGYSTIWLLICFIFGTALRSNQEAICRIKYIRLIAAAILIITPILLTYLHLSGMAQNAADYDRFLDYTSPLCVLNAAALFILCCQSRIRSVTLQKVIVWVNINSLGIYLVQCYQWIWSDIMISQPHPFYPAGELIRRFPFMLLLLTVNGLLCNVLVEKLFNLLRIRQFTGLIYDCTAEGLHCFAAKERNPVAKFKLLLILLLAVLVLAITWQ